MLKIAKSLIVILAVAAIATVATNAAWVDQETVNGNVFTSGTLDLTLNQGDAYFTPSNAPGGIFPGWSETKNIILTNSGSVNLAYNITQALAVGSDSDLYNSDNFKVNIDVVGGPVGIYNGPVHSMGSIGPRTINAGAPGETLTFTFSLDSSETGLMGEISTVDLTFTAHKP